MNTGFNSSQALRHLHGIDDRQILPMINAADSLFNKLHTSAPIINKSVQANLAALEVIIDKKRPHLPPRSNTQTDNRSTNKKLSIVIDKIKAPLQEFNKDFDRLKIITSTLNSLYSHLSLVRHLYPPTLMSVLRQFHSQAMSRFLEISHLDEISQKIERFENKLNRHKETIVYCPEVTKNRVEI